MPPLVGQGCKERSRFGSAGLQGTRQNWLLGKAARNEAQSSPASPCAGILCNWLVCLAVWQGNMARDFTGKFLGIFLPNSAFVAMGFGECWKCPCGDAHGTCSRRSGCYLTQPALGGCLSLLLASPACLAGASCTKVLVSCNLPLTGPELAGACRALRGEHVPHPHVHVPGVRHLRG